MALDAEQTIEQMAIYARQGRFEEAAALGSKVAPPLAICIAEFQNSVEIASRASCSVSRAQWRGKPVAVKKAKISSSRDLEFFRREAVLLSKLTHPNMTALLAARLLPPDYLLVMELGAQEMANKIHGDGWRCTPEQLVNLASQLADILFYLHTQGVLHRDINPSNILLDEAGDLKLTDFSIAEYAEELAEDQADRRNLLKGGQPTGGFHKRHLVGTLQYLAPEILLKQPASYAADIYAWAVTVNEIATGTFPFSDCTHDNPQAHTILDFGYGRSELAAAVAAEGLRPTLSPVAPAQLNDLISRCWALDPLQRPSAPDIVAELAQIRAAIMQPGQQPQAQQGAARAHPPAQQAEAQQAQQATPARLPSGGLDDRAAAWHSNVPPHAQSFELQVTAAAEASAGLRGEDRMEDRHLLLTPLEMAGELHPATHILAAFDGHRGAAAAEYCVQHLLQHLQACWNAPTAEAALQNVFMRLDKAFLDSQQQAWQKQVRRKGQEAAGSRTWPGCTAIVALIHEDHLWVANAGDCRAVLIVGNKAVQLTAAHTADEATERQRMLGVDADSVRRLQMSGKSQWRVGLVGLQVTRSIGDGDLKHLGLTAQPEVSHHRLEQSDTCLLLGSDGLWDYLPNQAAADLIRDTVKHPAMCARRLVTEALTRGSGDNVTAMVAFLQPVTTLERIYG